MNSQKNKMWEISNEILIGILSFVLLFSITFKIFQKILKDKASSGVIALATSIIGTFYLSYNQLNFLEKTYGLTGILALILFPFSVSFYFIYTSNISGTIRKAYWIFYSILSTLIAYNNLQNSEYLNLITTIILFSSIVLILLDNIIKNKFNAIRNLQWY